MLTYSSIRVLNKNKKKGVFHFSLEQTSAAAAGFHHTTVVTSQRLNQWLEGEEKHRRTNAPVARMKDSGVLAGRGGGDSSLSQQSGLKRSNIK